MNGVDLWLLEVGKLTHLNSEILLHHKTQYKTANSIQM